MLETNGSTKELVAALKFRFNACERRAFAFKGLAKASKNERPHRVIPPPLLKTIFNDA
jgi:hypothetical protein